MMKNYWMYILALLTIGISSCSVNEELVMLDEVDDVYIQPDDRFFATASSSVNDSDPIMDPMPDASNAERSYYQNTPYSADEEAAARSAEAEQKSAESSEDEYYDYYDEDYASRLQNFHGEDDNEYYMYGGNSMYNNRTLPPTASWPRFNWSINYGFSSFGYGARSGFGLGMGFGNPMMCNRFYDPFYDPWFDPYYSPYCDPYLNPWFRSGWGPGWGIGMNCGWGWNNWGWGNSYWNNPYWYGYGQGFVDASLYNTYNYDYNDQPTSGRRSRGGIVNDDNSGSGSGGSGIVTNNGTETREATRRSESRLSNTERRERNLRSENIYRREATSQAERSGINRRSDVSNSRYVRPQRNEASNYTRSRVAPYTRERTTRSSRTTRSNSFYNNSSRSRGNNSFYGSPSRSRSSSPSFSSPSSRPSSSPSRSGGSRRR